MELSAPQANIISDTHRFRVVVCGRKFGKTTLISEELIANAISGENRKVLYIAPTLSDARELMWDRLKNRLSAAIIKENDTRLELRVKTVKGGYSDIYLGSWEKVQSYRGLEYDFIVIDEVQDCRNFWVGWQEALRPTLTPRKGISMFTGTPKGFNHLYDLFNLPYKDTDYVAFKFTSYDNPWLPKEEIEKAKIELPEDRFAQEYLAEFRKSSGLVFKEFDRERHVYNFDIHGYQEYVAGIDFGYSNPTAIPHILVKDGIYYVCHELYRTQMTEDEICDYVLNERFNKVYPDPENPAAIEMLRRKGVNVRQVKKGKDSIQHGIQLMRELFKQNKLFIHKDCINLISELEMYSYADESSLRNQNENPQDKFNHAIDGVRYVVSNHSISKPFVPRPFYDRMDTVWKGK